MNIYLELDMYLYNHLHVLTTFLLFEVLSRVSSVAKESVSGLEKVMQMCQQPS